MELLERSDSLDKLKTAFESVIRGKGQTVFISGEAGIGKTALVRSFVKEQQGRHIFLEGYCDSLFAARPLGPLFDISSRLGSPLIELLKSNTGRDQIFPAAFEALESMIRPVILFFEDIQWADDATLDFIRFLARRISQIQCLFIVTIRDTEIPPSHPYRMILGELPPTDYLKLPLQPLSKESVLDMAKREGRDGEEIFRLTAGIPYYVSEVLATYHNKIPETVRDSILSLYHRQFDQTRELWEKISVIPGRIELNILQHLHSTSSRVVEFCYRAGIIMDDGVAISFKHELFRKTIEESLSPHRQRELHQLVVEAMLQATNKDVPYARLVHHARLAGDVKRLQEYASKAALEASSLGSHGEAAKFYQLGLENATDLAAAAVVELNEKYANECFLTSQTREAIRSLEASLKLVPENEPLHKGNTYRLLSRLYWNDGNPLKAEVVGKVAIEYCENHPPSRELAMAYSNFAQLMLSKDDTSSCIKYGEMAFEMADRLHDQEVECHALNTMGSILMKDPSTILQGEQKLKESLRIALAIKFDEHAARAYTNLCFAYVELGKYEETEKVYEEGITYCHDRDLHSWTNYLQCSKATLMLHKGQWDEALALSQQVLESPYQQPVTRILLESVSNTILMRRGKSFTDTFAAVKKEAERMGGLQLLSPIAKILLEREWLNGKKEVDEEMLKDCAAKIGANHHWPYYADVRFWMEMTGKDEYVAEKPELEIDDQRETDPYLEAVRLSTQGEDQQRLALKTFLALGAEASAGRIEGKMRDKGITQIPRGPRDSTRENVAGLTKRQMEVLSLMAKGMQNKEIAEQLFLSAKTIDHHISDILSRLDVNTRSKAVARALELGLL